MPPRDPYVKDNWEREYYEEVPLPFDCYLCDEKSVRLKCNMHGKAVAHPHGGIHRAGDDHNVYHFCAEHGKRQLRLNYAVLKRREAL